MHGKNLGLGKALESLKRGKFVVLFDSEKREAEADLVLPAGFATPQKIAVMRKDAGGLLCMATDGKTAKALNLPFASEVLVKSGNTTLKTIALKKTAYGDAPAFSIAINHANAFTGVTDDDKVLAAIAFTKISGKNANRKEFERQFHSPGHLPLLIGRGLERRRGHTELALRLCELAGLPPAVLVCEMLDIGKALSIPKAKAYAKRDNLVFLEGSEIS